MGKPKPSLLSSQPPGISEPYFPWFSRACRAPPPEQQVVGSGAAESSRWPAARASFSRFADPLPHAGRAGPAGSCARIAIAPLMAKIPKTRPPNPGLQEFSVHHEVRQEVEVLRHRPPGAQQRYHVILQTTTEQKEVSISGVLCPPLKTGNVALHENRREVSGHGDRRAPVVVCDILLVLLLVHAFIESRARRSPCPTMPVVAHVGLAHQVPIPGQVHSCLQGRQISKSGINLNNLCFTVVEERGGLAGCFVGHLAV